MKWFLLLLSGAVALAADTNWFGVATNLDESILKIDSLSTNDIHLKLTNLKPKPYDPAQRHSFYDNFDYTATNVQVEVNREPVVFKSNDVWIIRFR